MISLLTENNRRWYRNSLCQSQPNVSKLIAQRFIIRQHVDAKHMVKAPTAFQSEEDEYLWLAKLNTWYQSDWAAAHLLKTGLKTERQRLRWRTGRTSLGLKASADVCGSTGRQWARMTIYKLLNHAVVWAQVHPLIPAAFIPLKSGHWVKMLPPEPSHLFQVE